MGRAVVKAAVERGHFVRALVRPAAGPIPREWAGEEHIEEVRHDLRQRQGCSSLLNNVDAVIHLAAAKSGDLYEQLGGTVVATENLLDAMTAAGVSRLVLTSSFAVYEYLDRWSWSRLDEDSPLAKCPTNRDEYCQTKLFQERRAREHAEKHKWRLVVLRPGVIFGRGNLWSARLGTQAGRWWMCTGLLNETPLTYVENCAEAIVLAAEHEGAVRELVLNVVDERPLALTYINEVRRKVAPGAFIVPMPWMLMRTIARFAWLMNRIVFKGRGKLPGLLVPVRLHARCRPLRYPNDRIRTVLGWKPRYSWREGLDRSVRQSAQSAPPAVEEPAAVPLRQAV